MTDKLKPCPFCGGQVNIDVSDDEGNLRNNEYEQNPWSGLSYKLSHYCQDNEECPIATHDGETLGTFLYGSRKELVNTWNTRT